MKLIVLMLATLMGVCAALAQNNVIPRAIDPATMNPTQLSVLSVLKTALSGVSLPPAPTASNAPDPEWFTSLPADIKSLLPVLYPATAIAVEATPTPSSSSIEFGVATAPSLTLSPSPTPLSNEFGVATAPSLTLSDVLTANATSTAAVTITKSLQHAPGVTGTGDLGPTSNGTLTAHAPSASHTTSTVSGGASIKDEMKMLVAVMWIGATAGFCLFA
ncbi:hypothetical protein NX059_004014 [Plenodomus lindquistii]|nr:hypothetical protein NX059_004014 [Plenodomus lindquistii]